jgi:signal transduction histidine kinase
LLSLVAIAGWLALLTVAFNVVLYRRLDQQAQDIARSRATDASATVRLGRDGRPSPLESAGDAALDYGIWIYAGHTAVQRPKAPGQLQAAADSLAGHGSGAVEVGDTARLEAVPLRLNGKQVATVVASVSLDAYVRTQRTAVIGSAIVSILLLAGAYPVLRLTGRRALRPVEQMTHQADEWSAHAPAQRFGGGQRFAELQELATRLDGVLDRLSAVLRHERQLSAELSHELRTPLSTIVAETDLLIGAGWAESGLRAILRNAMTMNEIIETLLTTARAELQSDNAACDARAVVERLIHDRPYAFDLRGDAGAIVGVDEAIVTRLLSPVLDNVTRFARGCVVIEVARETGRVRVDIGNDGPPIAGTDHELIFDAGYSGGDGAGLGLTLARRLARAAEGDIVSVPSRSGATFRVTLPPG